MPPFGFRKRERSSSPAPHSTTNTPSNSKRRKPTIVDAADAPSHKQRALEETKNFLKGLDDDDDDVSSLSEVDSDEFEDIPPVRLRKAAQAEDDEDDDEENDDDDDDEMDWEDAIQPGSSSHATPAASKPEQEIGDISISVNEDGSYVQPLVSSTTVKKGPSKRERQIRVQTHCLHVQALMWHNTVINSWLNDKKLHQILVDGLTEGVKREVQRWKEAMGMLSLDELNAKKKLAVAKHKGNRGKKGKGKSVGRNWNAAAEHLEAGTPNLSGGDPLLRLLKVLAAYWRKRFTVTAPGLRKQGYKPLRRLRDEIKAWEKDRADFEEHGERIESLQELQKLAKKCEGSRDVGAKLFVALLRGLGLETRMVANLQPAGFGWSQAEEANEKKAKNKDGIVEKAELESEDDTEIKNAKPKWSTTRKGKMALKKEKATRQSARGNKSDPIDLDSDSPLSSAPSEPGDADEDGEDDNLSVVDITPSTPRKKPTKKYDRDVAFPNYWTEVCSPVSHKFYPVDPIVLSTIASSDELLQTFEPRGKKAEKAKQVMCYTIAFSSDGTAKDVTIRYLKRHQLPGKTKGVRMPVEKVPVYNRKGKVKKYEEYDWFRTLMALYDRQESKRTAADDLEEQTDLKPAKPAKEVKVAAKESLQGYKQSADYVLEQHLRREEAIISGAKPVKTFIAGKGDNAKEHPVYRREDIVVCKTVESWHKEGRAIHVGEQPLKYVPMRAVTLTRKREVEDAERETGEKLKQGLYSEAQTDWIIPPPIENGVIPRNAFGNMDVYVPTMIPKGAVHLPLKGTVKICKKLQIDFAEACTGFEFGKQRAVPVLTGVVVAEENARMVRDAWRADQEELRRKEDTKRTVTSLHWWRKMLLGLRVLERMRTEYQEAGRSGEDVNPFVLKAKREGRSGVEEQPEADVDLGGGFFPPGYDEEEVPQMHGVLDDNDAGGGFLVDGENAEDVEGGGFLAEDESEAIIRPPKNHAPITPVSLQSTHKKMNGAADSEDEVREPSKKPSILSSKRGKQLQSKKKPSKTKGKRKTVPSTDDDDDHNEDSSLSDLSDGINDESSPALSTSESENAPPSKTRMRASPHVGSVQSNPKSSGSRKRTGAAKKATPIRSRYFDHSDSEGGEDTELDSESESVEEIVRPRKTTKRTRDAT